MYLKTARRSIAPSYDTAGARPRGRDWREPATPPVRFLALPKSIGHNGGIDEAEVISTFKLSQRVTCVPANVTKPGSIELLERETIWPGFNCSHKKRVLGYFPYLPQGQLVPHPGNETPI
jgi:hypothetical protein